MGTYVELLKACKDGNAKKVKKLLSICRNIGDVRDLSDKTLLHYCFQNEPCTNLILENAPELLNVGEKSGYTVLHLAAMMKPPISLKFLLSKNPEINKKTNEGRSPLLLAVIYDNYDAIKILCENNAEINVTDCLGVSPLHYASKLKSDKIDEKQIEILELLLQHEAIIEFLDSYERTPLIWTVSSNNIIKMRYLLEKGANINTKDVSGLSILHYATSNGSIEILNVILSEYHLDIDTTDNNKCTSLMYACTTNQEIVVKFLLDKGANLNAEDIKKRTAVHFACGKGDIKILKILNDYNGDLWKCNEEGNFPLHEASFKGHLEIVQFLIEHHNQNESLCEVLNRKNCNGQSALHLAAVKDHFDICEVLLKHKSDPNILLRATNGKSMTALDLANKASTKQLIIQFNGKTTDDLINMCPITEENTYSITDNSDSEDETISDLTSSYGQNNNQQSFNQIPDKIQKDPLKYNMHVLEENNETTLESNESTSITEKEEGAIIEKEENEIKISEENDSETNRTIEVTELFRVSLLESCYNGNVKELKVFVKKGGDPLEIKDNTGKNLLHYSIKQKDVFAFVTEIAPQCINGFDDTKLSVLNLTIMSKEQQQLELLLNYNVDYNFCDNAGRTALHIAIIYNNIDALRKINQCVEDKSIFLHKSDNEGKYPLHYAVELYKSKTSEQQCQEFIEILLEMNENIECQDQVSRTPLLLAVNVNNIAAVVSLVNHGANILASDNHSLCSIHYACSEGNSEIFNILTKISNFDPDIEDQNGLTPIFYAVSSCNDKIVKYLIKVNCRVDINDKYGRNLCHKASEKGAFKCLELLISANVDPWLESNDSTMPLHEAAYRGYKEVAEILLKTKNSQEYVNIKNQSGQTALHLAAVRNDCPMCYLLINTGSSVNELLYDATNDIDVTPYDLATTPYCKETLYSFGGRSAKRILNNFITEDFCKDENISTLTELQMEHSNNEAAYSIRSTEFELSPLPSVITNATKKTDRTSLKMMPTTKASSRKSDSIKKKLSCDCSANSLLINLNNSNSKSPSSTKEKEINLLLEEAKIESSTASKNSQNHCLVKENSLTLSIITPNSNSKILTPKSSKRNKSSFSKSNYQNHCSTTTQNIQNKIQSSILNYEFVRLNSKIAGDIARQQIRKENIEKLINPKTPKLLRRIK